VFIYGDRGVGKTSLAQTAASLHHSADASPISLSCSAPFFQIIQDLLRNCSAPQARNTGTKKTVRVGLPIIGAEYQVSRDPNSRREISSINEAVYELRGALEGYADEPVVVFDEFDLVTNDRDKQLFADLIKQISDQGIRVKMIFTGIGRSISDLLQVHNSTARYLETIELQRLDIDSRLEIINDCADALKVEVGRDTAIRIAMVSDGFPHYVHLICEKMCWHLFNRPDVVDRVTAQDYVEAICQAAAGIQAFLREAYNQATRKYTNDYEEVLWAVADSPMLERPSMEIFLSYRRILAHLPAERRTLGSSEAKRDATSEENLRKRFNQKINRLKLEAHGRILIGTRTGWYEFRENLVRGYVRLRAEEAGVPLEVDHPLLRSKFTAEVSRALASR
jgi:AAA domain-containing protein